MEIWDHLQHYVDHFQHVFFIWCSSAVSRVEKPNLQVVSYEKTLLWIYFTLWRRNGGRRFQCLNLFPIWHIWFFAIYCSNMHILSTKAKIPYIFPLKKWIILQLIFIKKKGLQKNLSSCALESGSNSQCFVVLLNICLPYKHNNLNPIQSYKPAILNSINLNALPRRLCQIVCNHNLHKKLWTGQTSIMINKWMSEEFPIWKGFGAFFSCSAYNCFFVKLLFPNI